VNAALAAQLPLALPHAPDLSRETFVTGESNRTALALIDSWPAWPAPLAVLSGPPGAGKTHLASIWAERAGARTVRAGSLFEGAFGGLASRALALEDIDAACVPEQALFHLINAAAENGCGVLLVSRRPAGEWRVALADLRSRLRLATPIAVDRPDDALLRAVLAKLFADRQLLADPALLDYLVLRMERSLSFAAQLVETLDREALATGSRIGRPLAGVVLERLSAAGADVHDSE
jgi:chromosomal replication initiation ATPase DnaA